ncbi:hypothetical protein [Enterovibrio calviensis]|uniref:hypothetical protein n=1 Tax=Enterovibrio calviensis TaxID=91359 RepID=UPI0004873A73|nr:hypothetical protein [Enterovibrio calviensis]
MKKTILATLVISSALAQQAYAACLGNVYSLNAGRGHVGILVDVQESDKLTGPYNGTRALAVSRAAFSGAAMTYDSENNRIYYVSSPRPTSYYVQGLEDLVSEEELKSLDFHSSRNVPTELAYYDPSNGDHVIVGEVPATFRMAYDASSKLIYASDNRKLFTIDPLDGSTTPIANFDSNLTSGGFTSWGDFIFYKGKLLHITNTRTFSIDTTTGASTLEFFHYVNFVTGATLDQNGQILITAKNQNVTGNINSTHLWRLNPETGEKASVGLIPARLSALATNTQEDYTCYPATIFPSDMVLNVTGVTGSTVTEGETGSFTVNFDKKTAADTDLMLQLRNGSAAINSDYSGSVSLQFEDGTSQSVSLSTSAVTVTVPPGNSWVKVQVPTIENTSYENTEAFYLDAWFKDDKSDLASGTTTINDDDYRLGERLSNTQIDGTSYWSQSGNVFWHDNGYNFNWAGSGSGGQIWQNFTAVSNSSYSVNVRFWAHNSRNGASHNGRVEIIDLSGYRTLTSSSFNLREGNSTNISLNFNGSHSGNLRIRITNTSTHGDTSSTDLVADSASIYGAIPR